MAQLWVIQKFWCQILKVGPIARASCQAVIDLFEYQFSRFCNCQVYRKRTIQIDAIFLDVIWHFWPFDSSNVSVWWMYVIKMFLVVNVILNRRDLINFIECQINYLCKCVQRSYIVNVCRKYSNDSYFMSFDQIQYVCLSCKTNPLCQFVIWNPFL